MASDKYRLWLENHGLEFVRRLAEESMSESQIAQGCGISLKLYRRWKKTYPEFAEAITLGRSEADFQIVKSLYNKATGFNVGLKKTYKLKRVEFDPDTGKKLREYEELATGIDESFVPADLNAEKYWLENRQADRWGKCSGERVEEDSSYVTGVLIMPEADRLDDDPPDSATGSSNADGE